VATRIVIADDHKIVLQGLRSLLEQSPDLKVLAEAGTESPWSWPKRSIPTS